MNIDIHSSFVKDTKKLPSPVKQKLADIIVQIKSANNLQEITNCKKLTGYKTAYRIRIGDYRIGFFYTKDVVELTTILHRREIYKYFP